MTRVVPAILVVEDEPAVQEIYVRILRSAGFQVAAAPNGMQGLQMALDAPFDVVVTNSRMPLLSGADMVAAIRRDRPDQAILHVSGSHGLTASADRLPEDVPTLYKPFSHEDLIAAVRRLLPPAPAPTPPFPRAGAGTSSEPVTNKAWQHDEDDRAREQ